MKKNNGFTLVELLVTLVLVVIVTGVMYALYKSQNQTTIVQSNVADMQQSLRTGVDILSHDIRMAGYDPGRMNAYKISKAEEELMEFSADTCENEGSAENGTLPGGDKCIEKYLIGLYTVDGISKIRRTPTGSAVIENVDKFEFCYFDGGDHCPSAAGADEECCTTSPLNPDKIKEVVLSILIRSDREDSSYEHSITYKPGSHKDNFGASETTWGNTKDGYHRRMIVKRIKLRNMGH